MRTIADAAKELKDLVDVREWIARHAETRPGGLNTLVKCPFCGSGSFKHGRAQKTHYRCFRASCPTQGESLDIISLASLLHHGGEAVGQRFVEVVLALCEEFGVEPPKNRKNRNRKLDAEAAIRDAIWFWQQRLLDPTEGQTARAYLMHRGVLPTQIKRLKMGYAPRGGRLRAYLLKKGYSEQVLLKAGLITERGRDFFQERVIIPVNMEAGPWEGTLYGRSLSQNPNAVKHLYLKGREMQGLFMDQRVQRADTVIVSEGIFDALSLERALQEEGLPKHFGKVFSAATYGTMGFREEYVEHLLALGVSRVVVVADNDEPGLLSALRTGKIIDQAINVTVALPPAGEDPNSFYRSAGAKALCESISDALPLVDLEILLEIRKFDLNLRSERVLALRSVDRMLRSKSESLRELTIGELAVALGVSKEALRKDFQNRTRSKKHSA